MLRPNFEKWEQDSREMLRLATEAEHPRTRERCLALYMIGTGQHNATQWAQEIGRNSMTVQNWVNDYNEQGMAGVTYKHSGGPPPLFAQKWSNNSLKR